MDAFIKQFLFQRLIFKARSGGGGTCYFLCLLEKNSNHPDVNYGRYMPELQLCVSHQSIFGTVKD